MGETREAGERAIRAQRTESDADAEGGRAQAGETQAPAGTERGGRVPAREPIVRAKICIPAASADYLSRPRLNDALSACAAHRLTLVVAPAGYGKTSLVAFWARHLKNPPAWLSLNEADAPAGRFWRYVSHALDAASPRGYHRIFADVDPQADHVPVHFIDALLAAIDEDGRQTVCVLDDFHRIDGNAATMDALGYFLENCPENFHLVIASRSMPPLKLAKMRAAGELLEITQQALGFTRREVSAGLAAMQVRASDAFSDKVFDATFGWPVGIKLISLSLNRKGAPALSDDPSFALTEMTTDYLFEEVIERMPAPVRDFVLRLSVVENFCPSLALAVMQADDAQCQSAHVHEALQYLTGHSLFITEVEGPDAEPWYSFHALMRDALQWRAKHGDAAGERRRHHAASVWFEKRGLFDHAVRHAFDAGDFDAIRDVIVSQWARLLEGDQTHTLMTWFDLLPESYVSAHPKLCLFAVSPLSTAGRFEEAQRRFDQAKAASKDAGDLFDATAAALLSIFKAVKGDETGARAAAQDALALLPSSEKRFRAMVTQILGSTLIDEDILAMRALYRGIVADPDDMENALAACSAYCNLAQIEALVGDADQTFSCTSRAYATRGPQTYVPMFNVAYAAEAIASYLQGKLPRAAERCRDHFQNLAYNYTARSASQTYGIQALVAWHEGKEDEARSLLEEAAKTHPRGLLDLLPGVAFLARFAGTPVLRDLLDECTRAQAAQAASIPQRYFLLGMRLALGGETSPEATTQLMESIDGEYRLARVQAGILLALALEGAGEPQQAEAALAGALASAEPQSLVQPFLDAPAQAKGVVRRLAKNGAVPWAAFVNKAFVSLEHRGRPRAAESGKPPLSERELEVMRLAASGVPTDEIAKTLFISRETVKKHLGNTYAKLGTHNRAHAVSILKEQGLL